MLYPAASAASASAWDDAEMSFSGTSITEERRGGVEGGCNAEARADPTSKRVVGSTSLSCVPSPRR
eukprot:14558370-Ditylum_brightwellii.AAC.1